MVEDILAAVKRWARDTRGVKALVLVGSHARGEAGPDSDVDLVLLTSRPQELTTNHDWVEQFGDVTRIAREDWGRVQSLRVFYESGLEVEFGLTLPDWATAPDEGTLDVVRKGLRVFWDPTGLCAELPGQDLG